MFAWYGVIVVILSCIVLDADSSNRCKYGDIYIWCLGYLEIMPTLSDTLTEYYIVCIYLGKYNNLN